MEVVIISYGLTAITIVSVYIVWWTKLNLGKVSTEERWHFATGLKLSLRRFNAQLGVIEAIETLLAEKITIREIRRVKAALQMARLATIKTLSGFDFSFQPSLDRNRILYLAQLDFIDRSSISSANRHRQRSPRRSTWRRSNPCPHSQGTPSNAGKLNQVHTRRFLSA